MKVQTNYEVLQLQGHFHFKHHIDGLMGKLGRVCYAVRSLGLFVSKESLRMIYYSYFHAVMFYGIIFWRNSPHSDNIFKLQKRAIRIITNSRNRDSCWKLWNWIYYHFILSTYFHYQFL
jgi:hypothetical protein